MVEFDTQELATITYEGETFKVRKHLTIREEATRKGERSKICGGNYGQMNTSPDLDEQTVAFLADIITELDARIVDAPDSWKGAQNEVNDIRLVGLWKVVAQVLGVLPKDERSEKEESNSKSEVNKTPEH